MMRARERKKRISSETTFLNFLLFLFEYVILLFRSMTHLLSNVVQTAKTAEQQQSVPSVVVIVDDKPVRPTRRNAFRS